MQFLKKYVPLKICNLILKKSKGFPKKSYPIWNLEEKDYYLTLQTFIHYKTYMYINPT